MRLRLLFFNDKVVAFELINKLFYFMLAVFCRNRERTVELACTLPAP